MYGNTFTYIRRDINPTTGNNIKKLKASRKKTLAKAGNSVANTADIILNQSDNNFYGHNGIEWVKFGGSQVAYTSRTPNFDIITSETKALVFDTLINEKNITYTSSPPEFSVDIAGKYLVTCKIDCTINSTSSPLGVVNSTLRFRVNGITRLSSYVEVDETGKKTFVITGIISLETTDVVTVAITTGGEVLINTDAINAFNMNLVEAS